MHTVARINVPNLLLQTWGFSEKGYRNANVSATDPAGFIRHFRSAAPYIACHRGGTFLVVLPGEAMLDKNIVVRCGMGCSLTLEQRTGDEFRLPRSS